MTLAEITRDSENQFSDEREVEPVEVVLSHTPRRVTQMGVRRKTDVKLFQSWSPSMIGAAQHIRTGFCAITEGLLLKPASWERLDICQGSSARVRDHISDCETWYWRWSKEMLRYRLPMAPILDVIVFGDSCRQSDEQRRKRNGWTKYLIDEGLKVYCKERGWT